MIIHPDHGGTDYEFNLLKEAYDFLKDHAKHSLGELSKELQTIDGTPLTKLGRGLPIIVSAKDCKLCEGKGYKIFFNYKTTGTCPDCQGEGIFSVACKKCKGSGKYKNLRIGKVIGDCNLCGGSGKFYPPYKVASEATFWGIFGRPQYKVLHNGKSIRVNDCKRCNGMGEVDTTDKDKPIYVKCDECDGKGEIQIFNPVIPRGLLGKLG